MDYVITKLVKLLTSKYVIEQTENYQQEPETAWT